MGGEFTEMEAFSKHEYYAVLTVKLPTWGAERCVCVSSVPPCSVQLRHPAELPAAVELAHGSVAGAEGPQLKCCHTESTGQVQGERDTGTEPRGAQAAASKVGFSNSDQGLWMDR